MEEPDHSVDQRGRASASTTTTENERSHHRRHIRRPPSATSKTPRRRNTNPQSSSPPRRRDDDDATNNIKDDGITTNDSNNDKQPSSQPSSPLATPLTTLTTLLQTSHTHQQTLLTLFRTSHSLHLHAIDRKHKAIEALRLAQAELEHASTAEEFAMVELQRSKVSKDGACERHDVLRGEVSKLASGYNGVRVTLVNLTSNSNWNGRCGTIVNMITDNGEDLGRWKVRLDSDWRGKEPDGNYSVGDGGGGEGMLSQDWEHVVAKAENLKLINGGGGDVPSFLGGGRSQQQVDGSDVTKSRSTSRSPSRDEDGKGKHHPLDPVEELPEESYNHNIVTPERRGGRRRIYNSNNSNHQPSSPPQQHGDEYDWKRNALGSQHSPPGYYEPDDHHQFVHHRHAAPVMHHYSQVQKRQEEPPQQKKQLQRVHGHQHQQSKQQQQPKQQQQQQKHYVSPRAPKRSPKSSPNMQHHQQQQMYNRNQVSSFSEMMVSPESFAPISFQIETSESFSQRDAVLPPSSSFFEEVTPREDTQNVPNHQHYSYQEESNEEERSSTGPHSSLQAPATHSNSLPTVIVLPVDDEDEGNRNGPPTCVGVQNAGISHVNGLYVLAPNNHQDDEEESSSQPNPTNNADVPPLYFRDAEPILLSDKRYYDMCILRIDCPDSPEYVIWFLSRVDIDPDCLDVKFSDCYYYCRVLRSVGLYVPPMDGWSVPDVQQQEQPGDDDAVAFSTVDDEASFVNDQERLHSSMSSGLGIVPRSAEGDYV